MKKSLLFGMAAALLLVLSCTPKATGFRTEKQQFSDSTQYARLTIDAELPIAESEGAAVMRQTLVDVMDKALSHIDPYVSQRAFPRYDGDVNDSEALFAYYGRQASAAIDASARASSEERAEGIRESTVLTDEEKQREIAGLPEWSYDFVLRKAYETDKIIVFDSQNYVYLGGAHGGIVGDGPMTFDKAGGMRIRDFFVPDAAGQMQCLLEKGMKEYFGDRMEETDLTVRDFLHLAGGPIPLPKWAPMPTEKGLTLIYQQYEVAAYAAGMPSFTLPYEAVEPYLLPEAKIDLGL